VDLASAIESVLALGPQPHAYRRIRRHAGGMRLALKEWRVDFVVDGQRIVVTSLASGYRAQEIARSTAPPIHCGFAARFSRSAR
jgi:hypothetical protein